MNPQLLSQQSVTRTEEDRRGPWLGRGSQRCPSLAETVRGIVMMEQGQSLPVEGILEIQDITKLLAYMVNGQRQVEERCHEDEIQRAEQQCAEEERRVAE